MRDFLFASPPKQIFQKLRQQQKRGWTAEREAERLSLLIQRFPLFVSSRLSAVLICARVSEVITRSATLISITSSQKYILSAIYSHLDDNGLVKNTQMEIKDDNFFPQKEKKEAQRENFWFLDYSLSF